MTMTAGDLLDRLQEKLNDLGGVRWPDAEHFRAIDDAQQAILEARPTLFEKFAIVDTVAGFTQSVPTDCYRLFDVVANYSAADEPVGGLTRVDRATLDRHIRDWMSMDADSRADHWMQKEDEWSRYYLVPPQPETNRGKVELHYAARPTPITSGATELSAPDEAVNALYNFCMHRALEKDEKFAGSATAQAYMTKFAQFLAAKSQADKEFAVTRKINEDA
jgi:hypothetical protein